MASTSVPSAAGPRLQTLSQQGRGSVFFVVMFGLALLIGLRSAFSRGELLDRMAPLALALIGAVGLVAVFRLRQLALRAVALHEGGLVAVRGTGEELLAWADVHEVRRDVGPDGQLAFLLRLSGERLMRLRVPPEGTDAQLQAFVEQLVTQAGLAWSEGRARRAA